MGDDIMEDTIQNSSLDDVQFIVTGFGPFRGVNDNPTTRLAKGLRDHLCGVHTASSRVSHADSERPDRDAGWKSELAERHLLETIVMETSVADVQTTLDRIKRDVIPNLPRASHLVLLHLGVNYAGKGMQLEECAYNDASFRIKDEQGYQPKKQCIIRHCEIDAAAKNGFGAIQRSTAAATTTTTTTTTSGVDAGGGRTGKNNSTDLLRRSSHDPKYVWNHKSITTLPLSKICGRQIKAFSSNNSSSSSRAQTETMAPSSHHLNGGAMMPFEIKTSKDPGRFVCNYTYYYSLELLRTTNTTETTNHGHADSNKDDHDDGRNAERGDNHPSQFAQQVGPSTHSLFLHVPPLTLIGLQKQFEYVADLMYEIKRQLMLDDNSTTARRRNEANTD